MDIRVVYCNRSLSIGAFLAFKVVFTPLEYIPTIPPLSSYVINIRFIIFKRREGPQHISSAFLTAQGRLIHRYHPLSLDIYVTEKGSSKKAVVAMSQKREVTG